MLHVHVHLMLFCFFIRYLFRTHTGYLVPLGESVQNSYRNQITRPFDKCKVKSWEFDGKNWTTRSLNKTMSETEEKTAKKSTSYFKQIILLKK